MALRRGLRPFALLATMIVLQGAAPYGTEEVVPGAGPGLAVLVLVGMALFWALPYVLAVSELVSAIPEEGGIYRWLRAGMGPFWSFSFSILDWTTYILDGALYPPLVAAYLVTFFTPHPDPRARWLVGVAVIWICVWLNVRGIRVVGRLSVVLSVVVLAPMLAVMFLGLPRLSLAHLAPFTPAGQPFAVSLNSALIWSLWHYSGYGALAAAGEEIVDTSRTYPRALAVFLPLNALLFVLPLLAGLAATPEWRSWGTAHFNQVALALGGPLLAACMSVGAQIGAIGIFTTSLVVTSRLAFAMARDGMLPPPLARLHPRFGTPHLILILQAVLYSVLTYFFEFVEILVVSTWMALPIYMLHFTTPLLLRVRRPDLAGRFRIPGGRPGLLLVALVPSLIALYVLLTVDRRSILIGLAFMTLGPLLYVGSRCLWGRNPASPPC